MNRILAYLCAALLLGNVAVLFWPDDTRSAPHMYSPQTDINPHFVRLNKEIEDKYLTAQPTDFVDAESALLAESDAQGCYRLGPFLHLANYELAQAVLFNADVSYTKSSRASTKSTVFRVYIGPYRIKAEAADMRVELTRKNILDHFVRKEIDDQYIISLGIYTTQASADKALALFADLLDVVLLRQEAVVLPDSYWLHFVIGSGDQAREQLARMDWGEQSAKIGRFECQGG